MSKQGGHEGKHRADAPGRVASSGPAADGQLELPEPDSLRALQEVVGFDSQWLHLWASSPERDWYLTGRRVSRRRIEPGILTIVLAWILVPLAFLALDPMQWYIMGLATWGTLTIAWATSPYWAARRAFLQRRKLHVAYRVNTAVEEIYEHAKKHKELSLPMLFNLNRRQLDEYQVLTKQQQRAAFRLTWLAAFMGFAVLLFGIGVLGSGLGTDKYVVSLVAGLGAALSGYLGRTFFKAHQEAMKQLNYYYGEPNLTGRLLAAERITGNLKTKGGAQGEYVMKMVEALLDWENPVIPGHERSHHTHNKKADSENKAISNGGPSHS